MFHWLRETILWILVWLSSEPVNADIEAAKAAAATAAARASMAVPRPAPTPAPPAPAPKPGSQTAPRCPNGKCPTR